MTQVSFVGSGTGAAAQNGNVTPSLPAGLNVGDLLLVVGVIADSGRTFSAPAGWSSTTYARDTSSSSGPSLFMAWKAYASGDSDPTMTIGGTSAPGSGVRVVCLAYRNANVTTGPTFGSVYTSGATTGTDVGAISGVAVSGLGLALAIGGWAQDYSTPPSASGWTLDNSSENASATLTCSYGVLENAVNSATSSSVTITGHPTSNTTRSGIQVAINEASTNVNDLKVGGSNVGIKVGSTTPTSVYIGATKIWP